LTIISDIFLFISAIPFIYYVLAIFSAARYFPLSRREAANAEKFGYTPPISCLKPIKGLDDDAYDNFASFCDQDYPQYEIVFCVDPNDPAVPLLEKLIKDFPERDIRLLMGSGRNVINDKVGRLTRLTAEAKYDLFVITDGDIRVKPDYLRTVAAAFCDPKVGAATCLYASTVEKTFAEDIQSIAMLSDFFAGVMVAWKLDGIHFTFGQTIATTRTAVAAYGGYPTIEDRPADDVWAGRLVSEQGYEVKLLPYVVETVADFRSLPDLLYKRARWMTVMRLMRPQGHLGLIFTWGLPWALAAIAVSPTKLTATAYLGTYLLLRFLMTWTIAIWGMRQPRVWRKMPLIPLWDAMAFGIWVVSFARRTIRWRGVDYYLRDGKLTVPLSRTASAVGKAPIPDRSQVK
jgi:ceramide glucosyltransferase